VKTEPADRRDRLAQARAARAHRDPAGIAGAVVIFCGAAFFLFVMLVIFVLYVTRLVRSDFAGHFMGLFGLAAAFLSWQLIQQGQRMRARDAERVLAADARAPVVYLRPFAADGKQIESAWSSRVRSSPWEWYISHEQRLARALRKVGPFVAVGDPTEDVPELGAVRMYAADEDWQVKVGELSARAGVVLLETGESEGLGWEVRHVVSLGDPERVIVALPPPGRRGRRLERYTAFRRAFGEEFPRGLPESIGHCQFTYFDRDWTPRLLGQRGASLPAGDTPRELALRRLAREFKIMWGPRWARYTAYISVVVAAVDGVYYLAGLEP
jgi:hypothetical protein